MVICYETWEGFKNSEADMSVLLSAYNKGLTADLFVERTKQWSSTSKERGVEPLYTLGEHELEGKPSAYKIYMASADEYDAAMKLVGSLFHWQTLCEKPWFMEQLTIWREHMALRDYSLAKGAILKDVRNADGPAARKLLEMAARVINPPATKKTKKEADEKPKDDMDEMFDQYLRR